MINDNFDLVGETIGLGCDGSNIYRDNDENSLADFNAAVSTGEKIPDGGFSIFVVPWMEWVPLKKGHRVRFQPGSFQASIKAINNKEYPAFIYGDGKHEGFGFMAMANSLNTYGQPGSVKWWEAKDGLWCSFIPCDAPIIQDSIVANLRQGVIRQASIGSTILDATKDWNNELATKDWTASLVKIRETSPVAAPRYVQTKIYANASETKETTDMSETLTMDKDALLAAFTAAIGKDTEAKPEAESETANFSATEMGAAIGAAIGAWQTQQSAAQAGAQTVPQSETAPAEKAEASEDTKEDGNIINFTSIRERLSNKGETKQ